MSEFDALECSDQTKLIVIIANNTKPVHSDLLELKVEVADIKRHLSG